MNETTEDRCNWSDIDARDCDHCYPGPRPPKGTPPHQSEDIALAIIKLPPIHHPTGRALPDDTQHWQVYDYVSALCDNTRHAEPRTIVRHENNGSMTTFTDRHITVNPPLILQLWEAAATSKGMDGGNRVFGSSPSASLEALDMAMRIEHEVHQHLRHDHGLTNSYDDYPETIDAVRHLGSLTGHGTDNARLIKSWWAGARVVTGWDLPAWKPNNTCPLCAHRGSLRVKYPTAMCVECREVWDEDNIGLLVEHIRTENDDPETAPTAADTPNELAG